MNVYDKSPVVDKDVFVAPSASVIGDVQVGRASSIWYGCVLRGNHRLNIRHEGFRLVYMFRVFIACNQSTVMILYLLIWLVGYSLVMTYVFFDHPIFSLLRFILSNFFPNACYFFG